MTDRQKKLFEETKERYPDYLLIFRCGYFYESYREDAEAIAHDLSITLMTDEEGNRWATFPYYAADAYLTELVRAGHRVIFCYD